MKQTVQLDINIALDEKKMVLSEKHDNLFLNCFIYFSLFIFQ